MKCSLEYSVVLILFSCLEGRFWNGTGSENRPSDEACSLCRYCLIFLFYFILCHHLHATGRVRSQENRVMLSLGVEFFRARNDQYETFHEYYVIDKEFSWRMLDFLLISFSDLFGQGTKDPRTWLTSCEKNRARENEHLEDSPGFESRRWLRIPLIFSVRCSSLDIDTY